MQTKWITLIAVLTLGIPIPTFAAGRTSSARPYRVPFAARPSAPRALVGEPVPALQAEPVLAALSLPDPMLALSADKRRIALGDTITFSGVFSVPATETLSVPDVMFHFTPISPLIATGASGPKSMSNTAICRSDSTLVATSNTVYTKASGQTQTYAIQANGEAIVPLGTVAPGESETATVTCKW
jgi:hypothetical protein